MNKKLVSLAIAGTIATLGLFVATFGAAAVLKAYLILWGAGVVLAEVFALANYPGRLIPIILLALALPVGTAWAEDHPALPDYTKAPFAEVAQGNDTVVMHKDAGELPYILYADNPYRTPGSNGIWVHFDKDGKPLYADWWAMDFNGGRIRSYAYRDGAWVPDVANQQSKSKKYPKGDVRDKNFVWHLVPLQFGLTAVTQRNRSMPDMLHAVQFTGCRVGRFRACGMGLTFGFAADESHRDLYTLAVSFPVTVRLVQVMDSEIDFSASPYYDLRWRRWSVAYGLSAAF